MAVERRAEEPKNGAKEGTGTAQRDQIRRELPTNGSHPCECRRQNRCSRGEPEATDSRRRIANLPKESDVREADGRSRHAGEPRQGAPSGTPQRWSTGDRHLETHWEKIRAKLLVGTYVPAPVRRVEIPKPSGGARMLGIPTVLDRFIQQLLLQAMTPIFEPMFSDQSYGFRPGRSAADAIRASQEIVGKRKDWVVDGIDRKVPAEGRDGGGGGESQRRGNTARWTAISDAGEHLPGRARQGTGKTRARVLPVCRRLQYLRRQLGGRGTDARVDSELDRQAPAVKGKPRQERRREELGNESSWAFD